MMTAQTTCQTQTVCEYKVFYQEAVADSVSARLMFDNFRSSNQQLRNIIPFLAEDFRDIAPGFLDIQTA